MFSAGCDEEETELPVATAFSGVVSDGGCCLCSLKPRNGEGRTI